LLSINNVSNIVSIFANHSDELTLSEETKSIVDLEIKSYKGYI